MMTVVGILAAAAQGLWIIGRIGDHLRFPQLREDRHFELGPDRAKLNRQQSKGHIMPEHMCKAARSDPANQFAMMINALMRYCAGALGFDLERRQPPRNAARLLPKESVAPDEV